MGVLFVTVRADYPHPEVPLEAVRESIRQHLDAYGFRNVRMQIDSVEDEPEKAVG